MIFEGYVNTLPESLEENKNHITLSQLKILNGSNSSQFLIYGKTKFEAEVFIYIDSELDEVLKLSECTIEKISHSNTKQLHVFSLYEIDLCFEKGVAINYWRK